MKKILIIFFATASTFGQLPTLHWEKSFGGSSYDTPNCITMATDGNYIVAGRSSSIDGDVTAGDPEGDLWVMKINEAGDLLWQKSPGGSGDDEARAILPTADGGCIIAGRSNSTDGPLTNNHGSYDIWIIKMSVTGFVQWQKCFGGTGADDCSQIIETSDAGYAIIGSSLSQNGDVSENSGSWDSWIIKIDGSGTIQWQKSYGGSDADLGNAIIQTADDGFLAVGNAKSSDGDISSNNGEYDLWIFKTDNSGALAWEKTYGGTLDDYGLSLISVNNNYYISGATFSTDGDISNNYGMEDYWLLKIDSVGNVLWNKTYGGSGADWATDLTGAADGGVIISGFSNSFDGDVTGNHGGFDYWFVKVAPDGIVQWDKSVGGSGADQCRRILPLSSQEFIAVGGSNSLNGDVSQNNGLVDFWIVKLSSEVLSTAEVARANLNITPNPAIDKIELETDISGPVLASDITGKTLKVFAIGNIIDIEALESGMYILEACSGDKIFRSKFIKQ